MKDKVFIDSNILIYSYSKNERDKQKIARTLISENISYISTQVIQEFTNTVTRKFKFSFGDAQKAITECCQNNILHVNTEYTILYACQLAIKYGFSFYDCLILAASLESECVILYSEDMQHGQMIEKKLKIINPFK
jgi:predicted nucleic acid-binding protein